MIQTYNKFQLKSTKKSKQFKDLTTGQQMLNIIYTQSNLYFFASPSLLLHCFFPQPRSCTTYNFLSLNGVQDYIFTQILPVLRSYSRNSRFKTQKTSLMCLLALQVSTSPHLNVSLSPSLPISKSQRQLFILQIFCDQSNSIISANPPNLCHQCSNQSVESV